MTINTQNISILIVDDSPAQLELMQQILKDTQFQIHMVTSGIKAFEFLKNNQVDLIILDIVMPDMNGYDVCLKLQSDFKTKDIPVIFLSSLSNTNEVVRGLTFGGVDFIIKPLRPQEFVERVKVHVRLKKEKDAVRVQLEELRKANRLLMGTMHQMAQILDNQ